MSVYIGTPTVICTCGQHIHEIDTLFCNTCGDVMCQDCMAECVHCDNGVCIHCQETHNECIKCYSNPVINKTDKAYILINGETTPISNSEFMIQKTSSKEKITLKLDGRIFDYKYRTITTNGDNHKYFMLFDEVVESIDYENPLSRIDRIRSEFYDHYNGEEWYDEEWHDNWKYSI